MNGWMDEWMNEWMDEWLARETGRSSHGLTGFIIQCSAVQIMLLKTIFGQNRDTPTLKVFSNNYKNFILILEK